MEIKKVGVLSLAKIMLIFGAILAVILDIVLAILQKTTANLSEEVIAQLPQIQALTSFSLTSALLLIVWYAVIGFISGVVAALLYNVIAKLVGGIKLEFKK